MSGAQKKLGTLRPDLKILVEELQFEELGLVNERIMPVLTVQKESGTYPVLPREAIAKVPDISRSPDGSFKRGEWEWTAASYTTEMTGYEEPLDVVSALVDSEYLDEEEVTARRVRQGLLLGNESKVAGKLFNLTTFAGNAIANPDSTYFSGSSSSDCHLEIKNEFDDFTSATPFAVIDLAYKQLRKKNLLAKKQFSLVASDDVVSNMLRCDEVADAVKYVEPLATMSAERKRSYLAEYLGIKEIVPVSAWYDTTGLGKDADFGAFWSDEFILLAKLSQGQASFKEGCLGRQLSWSKWPFQVDTYYKDENMSRIYRATQYRGMILNTDYGILLSNATEH